MPSYQGREHDVGENAVGVPNPFPQAREAGHLSREDPNAIALHAIDLRRDDWIASCNSKGSRQEYICSQSRGFVTKVWTTKDTPWLGQNPNFGCRLFLTAPLEIEMLKAHHSNIL